MAANSRRLTANDSGLQNQAKRFTGTNPHVPDCRSQAVTSRFVACPGHHRQTRSGRGGRRRARFADTSCTSGQVFSACFKGY